MKKQPRKRVGRSDLQKLVDNLLKHCVLPVECAEILGLKVDDVRNYCRRDRFAGAVRLGNEWLIPRETVQEYLTKSRGRPGRKSAEEAE